MAEVVRGSERMHERKYQDCVSFTDLCGCADPHCTPEMKCENLPPMDANGLADPYVRVDLFPPVPGINRQKTDILKETRQPNFEGEMFTL